MKQIRFMDVSFRDGFQSCLGARVKTEDFLPAFEAALEAGIDNFEIGGGARFQSLYFYCQQDAFEMMDQCRKLAGPDVNLQTLSRGSNVVGLVSQCRDMIDLHAKLFHKHGVSTIRNFDALNDVRNLDFSGRCIHKHGLKHQVVVSLMGLPPGLNEPYAHTAKFYVDTLKKIIEAGIPYDSVCFKDASGTSTPQTVYDTVKQARAVVGADMPIEFHTHFTAGSAGNCLMAAIEAGADLIDLAMAPVSGGTSHADILTMWHILRGTDYVLANSKGEELDYEKVLLAEEKFKECMEPYFMGPEAFEVNPLIVLSPMPGGALTANTQMMRDNKCMHLYNDAIKAMREVVAKGGYGTSVTPVSQFYFQQAFANVTQGMWKKITDGYGKMVLGYFGQTPAKPDPEVVKLASEQLGLAPTTEDVHDINDRDPKLGVAPAKKMLEDNGLPATEENIFIIGTCGEKGLAFLKGSAPLMTRMKVDEDRDQAEKILKADKDFAKKVFDGMGFKAAAAPGAAGGPAAYTITVNGKSYHVDVAPAVAGAAPQITGITPVAAAPAPAAAPAGAGTEIVAPMPGTVLKILVEVGATVADGDTLVVLEAMKMEQPIKAHGAGVVQSIEVAEGETVESGQVVAII
ncbi:MAG: biotin/lipoyl-containing protein [Lentisphaeria bacterium]|jgi:pyruvate carboxylase subunit B|nr:biotin/lipoyl-containing protein [Lentisphaeria bacterium]